MVPSRPTTVEKIYKDFRLNLFAYGEPNRYDSPVEIAGLERINYNRPILSLYEFANEYLITAAISILTSLFSVLYFLTEPKVMFVK